MPRAGRLVDAAQVLGLQRTAGNRAVSGLVARAVVVQRGPALEAPPVRQLPPATGRWESRDPYRDEAVLVRTTRVEATGWGETAAAPPHISYRREVELQTVDGISFYLDIRGTVALAPGTVLPTSADAAVAMTGRLVRGQRTTRVEGGDVVEVNEYSPQDLANHSFGFLAGAVLPGYAQLDLTPGQQEKAILRYLAGLPRRPKSQPAAAEAPGAAVTAFNLATDFVPIVGELKDLYRAVTGEDPVTGEKLAWWERALAALGAIPLLGRLVRGLRELKFLGRGLSWLKGRGAELAAWFSEKIARWRSGRKARQLEKEAEEARRLGEGGAVARAAKRTLRENEALIAVVGADGTILATHSTGWSHRELIKRELGGVLPKGAEAVTIGKEGGKIEIVRSWNVHGNSLPASESTYRGVRAVFD